MRQVSIREAKAQFSELIEAALAGEEIIITRYGRPLVRMDPIWPGEEQGRPAQDPTGAPEP